MSLIYVLLMTVARAGFSRRFLSSVGVEAEAETGKCARARQQLPLHRGSGAQTAVGHIKMKEEKTQLLAKNIYIKKSDDVPLVQIWTDASLLSLKQTNVSHQA